MTDIESDKSWKAYFYPGTDVLINKFNIKDNERLKEVEATVSFEKLLELNREPLNLNFDKNHLKSLHKYIFDDIYPFAGKYRNVNLRKERGSFLFIKEGFSIDEYLDYIFAETNKKLLNTHSKHDFSEVLAFLYTQLIYCHPFREGNGRTIREFIREFSIVKSRSVGLEEMELNWSLINKDELNQYLEVAHMFPGATGLLFNQALVKTDNYNQKK